ncbi:unnamed protein product [Brassica rapa]|uniref:Uncharacterized protein n=1 Tax=Brassica campestris TaxID=3711 RepID=A0A3P6B4E6_BRACM|nr:unnamed protein product [Brassica rapa]VDC92760.1 unnamed protein product [Brassica rapa]
MSFYTPSSRPPCYDLKTLMDNRLSSTPAVTFKEKEKEEKDEVGRDRRRKKEEEQGGRVGEEEDEKDEGRGKNGEWGGGRRRF